MEPTRLCQTCAKVLPEATPSNHKFCDWECYDISRGRKPTNAPLRAARAELRSARAEERKTGRKDAMPERIKFARWNVLKESTK